MNTPRCAAPRRGSASIPCPHCTHPAAVRTSRQVTPVYRELYLQCGNIDCGHTFAASLSITHTISPSACPDPAIDLPVSPPRLRKVANDNAANENGELGAQSLGLEG